MSSKSNINSLSPNEILNKLAIIFETSRENKDIKSLKEGVELSNNVDLSKFNNEQKATFHFFVANGWSYILRIKYNDVDEVQLFKSQEIEKEIFHLRTALSYTDENNPNICQILTNLGCAFNHIGRYSEAQEYFNKAIAINPDFGMAIGNKGAGLFRYARNIFDGVYQFIFLQYSRKYLLDACNKNDVYAEAKQWFEDLAKHITTVHSIESLNDFKTYNDIFKDLPLQEIKYRQWCIDNTLFLNHLNDVMIQDTVARDTLYTPAIVINKKEKPIYYSLYNQIKQEFVSARFFYYEGITRTRPHISDKFVSLYNYFDNPVYSFSMEKVKTSFRICYSIFDKIAYFINIYLNLNIHKSRVSFRNIWHKSGNRNNPINDDIFKFKNISLEALYWLSKEIDEGTDSPIEPEAKEIATIRNYMEHKSFKVVDYDNYFYEEQPETYEINRIDFYKKVLKILKLTRSALIYLSSFIYEEESRRKPIGLTQTIEMEEIGFNDKI